jgi:bifunctional non-homologous end joining protein LigD
MSPITPMLATYTREPFHRPGWVYEEKYDGYRIVAYKEGKRVRLVSRHGRDWTEEFAAVTEAIAAVPARSVILDGEVVVFKSHLASLRHLLYWFGSNYVGQEERPLKSCFSRGYSLRQQGPSRGQAPLRRVLARPSRLVES